MKYSKKQLNAISRNISKRNRKNKKILLLKIKKSLDNFNKSKYKTTSIYIYSKYNLQNYDL